MTLRSFFPFSCHLVLCYSLHNSTVFFGGLRGIIFNVCCISMHILSQSWVVTARETADRTGEGQLLVNKDLALRAGSCIGEISGS